MENYWVISIVTTSVVGFLVVVMLGASFCTVIAGQREDKKLCDMLRTRLQAGEAERQQRRVSLLRTTMQADAAEVEKFAGIVQELENRLHEKLITIFSENKEQFALLDRTVEELINSFCVSTTAMMKPASSPADIHGELSGQRREAMLNSLSEENAELTEENAKLKRELETMRKESERVMAEYISMYSDKGKKPA